MGFPLARTNYGSRKAILGMMVHEAILLQLTIDGIGGFKGMQNYTHGLIRNE
jgi:hypothetical protein